MIGESYQGPGTYWGSERALAQERGATQMEQGLSQQRAGLIEQHHRLSTWNRPQFRLTKSADILVTVRFQNDEREQDEMEGMTKFNVAMLRVALKIARTLAGVKA
jgi:hypothetical protein